VANRRDTYKVLVVRAERKKPLGRSRNRWEENNKMDLEAVGCCHGLDSYGSG
jgi:hypothetical protein